MSMIYTPEYRSSLLLIATIACVLLSMSATTSRAQEVFEGLGDLPGGIEHSHQPTTSTDGNRIVGRSFSEEGSLPFLWTPEEGMTALNLLPGQSLVMGKSSLQFASSALVNDMSADGAVLVGHYSTDSGSEAFVRRGEELAYGVGVLANNYYRSLAIAVSDDGTRIIGYGATLNEEGAQNRQDIVMWTESTGWQVVMSATDISHQILGFSGDGQTIYGYEEDLANSTFTAFKWTASSGQTTINLPLLENAFFVQDVSYDGSLITGMQQSEDFSIHAATWSETGGVQNLNELEGSDATWTFGANSDGTIIGGFTSTTAGSLATVWTNGEPELIQTMFESNPLYAEQLEGWELHMVHDISSDGTVFVGVGINPDGNTEAWRADVSCLLLVGKTLPAECECSVPEYSWVPGQGILFSSGTNWDPEGPPSDSSVAQFDVSGFIPVEFLNTDSTEALEVTRGTVQLDLNGHEFISRAETDCLPGIRIDGASTELIIKGDEGVLRSRDGISINSGTVTITEGTAMIAPEVTVGSSGRTSVNVEHGFLTSTEILQVGVGLEDSTTISVIGSNEKAFLHLGPSTEIGVSGFARIDLAGNSELLGPTLGSLETRPLHARLGVNNTGHGEIYIDSSTVQIFPFDFDREITFTVGENGTGLLELTNEASIRIDFLNIGKLGHGEVNLDFSVLVIDSTLTMADREGSTANLTLAGDSLLSVVSLGNLAFVGLEGEATVTVAGHAQLSNALARVDTTQIFLGASENAEGNLIVTGAEASLVSGDSVISVTIGARGRGDIQVVDGARMTVEEVWVGRTDTGFGSMYVGTGAVVDLDRLAVGPGAFGVVQVEEDALVTTDLLWVADNGQIIGDVLSIGTFEPGKRAAGISARGLLLSNEAELNVANIDFAADAILGGSTTWQTALINSGGLMPGDFNQPTGVFTAGAGYEQTNSGFLEIELGGEDPGTGHDLLNVVGTAVLDGVLRVEIVPGFIPDVNSTYTIVEADAISGSFATVESPEGVTIEVAYEATRVVATVTDVTLVSVDPDSPVALESGLRSNYPNPFSHQTTIVFDLSEQATVELVVYDLLGRKVEEIRSESLPTGRFEQVFDADHLPSGTYLYRMIATGPSGNILVRESRSMVLVR
ncbi:MAG: T9SS type A sorting domain-containing protein [Rhodothermales bacterium]|nr:T9SS type A sorting domain-containing protein [Rhodothermales bacterium]